MVKIAIVYKDSINYSVRVFLKMNSIIEDFQPCVRLVNLPI